MENIFLKKPCSVEFWDMYARWYKLWMEHSYYHNQAIDVLTTMVKPGWKILDVGAGNGILSLPLCAIECDVTAIEPSIGMRNLLYQEAFKRGIDWIKVDERRWEDIPNFELNCYDLIVSCNSLHLTGMGFAEALNKMFLSKAKNLLLITERYPDVHVSWSENKNHELLFAKCYEADSSFFYHNFDEAVEHLSVRKGGFLCWHEISDLKSRLSFHNNHFCFRDKAYVSIYWWRKIANSFNGVE
jgi:cyclopropane fatty-acyl-phospholipid synthase-like methyltransferase